MESKKQTKTESPVKPADDQTNAQAGKKFILNLGENALQSAPHKSSHCEDRGYNSI